MTTRTCSIEGCDKVPPPSGKDHLCGMHRHRVTRHGDPTIDKSPPGTGWTTVNGYHARSGLGHPLQRHGRVNEGRIALYAKLGPGEHRCHFCDATLAWGDDARPLKALHLNGDKSDDQPANLVPGCRACIFRRTIARRWGKELPQ